MPERAATLCLITDRRRLAASQQIPAGDAEPLLLAQIAAAGRGGVQLVQIRERDLEAGALVRLVRSAIDAVRGTPARIVVNDRVDVAAAAGAGVHLREAGLPAAAARRLLGVDALIGRSVHGVTPLVDEAETEYLIAGTVFGTASKPGAPRLGPDGLRAIVSRAGGRRVLAVGGITIERLAAVRASGAAGVAAIGLFLPPGPVGDLAASVEEIVKTVRFSFDTPVELP